MKKRKKLIELTQIKNSFDFGSSAAVNYVHFDVDIASFFR
jgi:hypothetical protein